MARRLAWFLGLWALGAGVTIAVAGLLRWLLLGKGL
jgi:hypothetical protein